MIRTILKLSAVAICCAASVLSSSALSKAQTEGMPRTVDIAVQVLDGRSGKPIPSQRLLVFVGNSSEEARGHAEHTELTTDKDGVGMLTLHPSETGWIQVWADGRVLCYQDPNQASFSVDKIVSTGFVTANDCGATTKDPMPGHLIVFARPARFMEKMKR